MCIRDRFQYHRQNAGKCPCGVLVICLPGQHEIGSRKALGAKEHTSLSQFVVEAATTSALGGALGIALGYICLLYTS